VKRNDDFTPKDVDEALEKASTSVLNLKRAGAISLYQMVKDVRPDWTEEEIEEEVERIRGQESELLETMVGA